VVRTELIIGLFFGLVACPATFAQKQPEPAVRIVCHLTEHPKLIKMVRPTYPEPAKQARIEGTVLLMCIIGVNGSVEKIEVIKGHELLAKAAIDAVSQWKYEPVRLNEKPVQADTSVRIIFQLPKEKKKAEPDNHLPG